MPSDKTVFTQAQLDLFEQNFGSVDSCCDVIEGLSTLLVTIINDRAEQSENKAFDGVEFTPPERWGFFIALNLIHDTARAARSLALQLGTEA